MKIQHTLRWLTIIAAIAVMTAPMSVVFAQGKGGKGGGGGGGDTVEYDIHQLDSDNGDFSGYAADLNDAGTVVGRAVDTVTDEIFAAYWDVTVDADGTLTSSLSLLPGSLGTVATGVNNLGEIVGNDPILAAFGGVGSALYWPSVSEAPLSLDPLSGDTDALPHSINDVGVICGVSMYYEDLDGEPDIQEEHPVIWRVTSDSNGNTVVLGPFSLPGVNGIARDLSESDADGVVTVVGNAWDGTSSAAVTWQVQLQSGGVSIDPQPTVLQSGANAYGLNDTGVVCGDSGRPDWVATLWTDTDQIPLLLPRKFDYSGAEDLNDDGIVVGWVSNQIGGIAGEAAVWAGPDAKPVLLSKFLGRRSPFDVLTDAPAINQAGRIVGAGWDGNDSVQQAFIALPK